MLHLTRFQLRRLATSGDTLGIPLGVGPLEDPDSITLVSDDSTCARALALYDSVLAETMAHLPPASSSAVWVFTYGRNYVVTDPDRMEAYTPPLGNMPVVTLDSSFHAIGMFGM